MLCHITLRFYCPVQRCQIHNRHSKSAECSRSGGCGGESNFSVVKGAIKGAWKICNISTKVIFLCRYRFWKWLGVVSLNKIMCAAEQGLGRQPSTVPSDLNQLPSSNCHCEIKWKWGVGLILYCCLILQHDEAVKLNQTTR